MNPTVANIVEQARMGYLALRTGDYRDLRRAVDHLTAFPSVPFGIMARLVRAALLAGNLGEARNALRFVFEDGDAPDGVRPAGREHLHRG